MVSIYCNTAIITNAVILNSKVGQPAIRTFFLPMMFFSFDQTGYVILTIHYSCTNSIFANTLLFVSVGPVLACGLLGGQNVAFVELSFIFFAFPVDVGQN